MRILKLIFQESLWNNLKKSRTGRLSGQERLKPVAVLNEYWKNNERFADFFNAVLFDGREVIQRND